MGARGIFSRAWSSEEEQKMIALAQEGLKYHHIGIRLARSGKAIEQRMRKLRREGRLPDGL